LLEKILISKFKFVNCVEKISMISALKKQFSCQLNGLFAAWNAKEKRRWKIVIWMTDF